MFGYVLLMVGLGYGIAYFILKTRRNPMQIKVRKLLFVWCIAFATILPYLIYTYSITGRIFYFGNSGGMSLYWMSTPIEHEFGDWTNEKFTFHCDSWRPCNAEFFAKNHQKDIDFVNQFKGVEKDDAYKKLAFENIRNYPKKYVQNCVANIGRLFFGQPYSYYYQGVGLVFYVLLPNSIILTLMLVCLPLWLYNFKKCRAEINFLTVFLFIYLFVSVFLSAYPRQFFVIVPGILMWVVYILSKSVKISVKFSSPTA